MATERQILANRRNGALSKGPVTATGRSVSRMNALKHGLNAASVIISGEDPQEFETLRNRLIEEFQPNSHIDEQLVEHLAVMLWRLRRVSTFEAAIVALMQRQNDSDVDDNLRLLAGPSRAGDAYEITPRTRIVGAALRSLAKEDILGKLNRTEAHLLKQIRQICADLKKSSSDQD